MNTEQPQAYFKYELTNQYNDISMLTYKADIEIEPTKITKLHTHKPAQLVGRTQAKD
jgi:hypothetical protein